MTPELSTILEGMTKVFEERIDFPAQEIERLMAENPQRLILVVERKEDGHYYSTIYVKEQEH
jgi:hypothetical protein